MANADDSFSAEFLRPFGSGTSFLVGPPLIANPPVTAVFPMFADHSPV